MLGNCKYNILYIWLLWHILVSLLFGRIAPKTSQLQWKWWFLLKTCFHKRTFLDVVLSSHQQHFQEVQMINNYLVQDIWNTLHEKKVQNLLVDFGSSLNLMEQHTPTCEDQSDFRSYEGRSEYVCSSHSRASLVLYNWTFADPECSWLAKDCGPNFRGSGSLARRQSIISLSLFLEGNRHSFRPYKYFYTKASF